MQKLADGLFFDNLDGPRLIAVVEHNRIVDLWTEQDGTDRLGAVHLVRVTGRFAAHHRVSGQLSSGDAVSWPAKGQAKPVEGQLALITLTAAARDEKPVQAVSGIELAGRYMVMRWHGFGKGQVYLSRKAGRRPPADAQISRLTELCDEAGALAAGFEVVLRRSALSPDHQLDEQRLNLIQAEVARLLADWHEQAKLPEDLRTQTQPRPVYAGLTLANRCRLFYPDLCVRQLGHEEWPAVRSAYDEAKQARYETAQGAVLWIEQTRAAVTVDIDSAASKLAPGRLCMAVLPELFTQIGLRRLAGKILVDMPYVAKDKREHILTEIDRLSRRDVRYPDCLGFTRSGLLELSVRHDRQVLDKDEELQAVINDVAERMG